MKICFVVSAELTAVAFLAPHLRTLAAEHDLCIIANTSNCDFLKPLNIEAEVKSLAIERRISIGRDFSALLGLVRLFRSHRFDAVHSITPKAGLLAMVAAWLAGVPIRVHTFTGQVWATRQGAGRVLLKAVDRVIARLANHLLTDSPSQLDFLVREGVVNASSAAVLADGSICGVDPARFRPDVGIRTSVRQGLGIPDDAVLVLYLGRLRRDKGILDMAAAFATLGPRLPKLWMLLVGPDEDRLEGLVRSVCMDSIGRVVFVGFTDAPERYMTSADIFCLPSYREGFGSSVIEAAACGVPAVASRIYGLTDAVQEGATGLLHPPGDVQAMVRQLAQLARDGILRKNMGLAARERAICKFSQVRVTSAMREFYRRTRFEVRT